MEQQPDPAKAWRFADPKNAAVLLLIMTAESFLIAWVIKRVIHGSALLYLMMLPAIAFALIVVFRHRWLMRLQRSFENRIERDLERGDKWTPPGLP